MNVKCFNVTCEWQVALGGHPSFCTLSFEDHCQNNSGHVYVLPEEGAFIKVHGIDHGENNACM